VTARLRVFVLMVRPAVLYLLALSLCIGLDEVGGAAGIVTVVPPVVAVVGFLLFSVALNDLADEEVDRVNLPSDPQRLLVSGVRTRAQLVVTATTSAVASLAAAAVVGWQATALVAAGLLLGAAYSLPPARLAARGAVASLVLPACFVAVPYLLGVLAAAGSVTESDLVLLVGLYLGFIGRILLKDFRDVRGDALFGKRTFLVRHGRVATCRTSAAFWAVGTLALLLALRSPSWSTTVVVTGCLVASLWLLHRLADDGGPHRDEALVSALAIVGRGTMLAVLGHLATTNAGWSGGTQALVLAGILALTLGQAREMVRHGPRLAPWDEADRQLVPAGSAATPDGAASLGEGPGTLEGVVRREHGRVGGEGAGP
jgi:4-hydroxybenzoate polyprenyltransferase